MLFHKRTKDEVIENIRYMNDLISQVTNSSIPDVALLSSCYDTIHHEKRELRKRFGMDMEEIDGIV